MKDKLDKAVEAIILKTKNNMLDWERVAGSFLTQNLFYRQYILDREFKYDGMNFYIARYNKGYIYFSVNDENDYKELAIQPNDESDITVLACGVFNDTLDEVENIIKNILDNPDDFIESLLI